MPDHDDLPDVWQRFCEHDATLSAEEAQQDAERKARRLRREPEEPLNLPGVTMYGEAEMVAPGTLTMAEALERAGRRVDGMVARARHQQRSHRTPRRPSCGVRRGRSRRGRVSRGHARRSATSRDDGDGGPGEGDVGSSSRGGAR